MCSLPRPTRQAVCFCPAGCTHTDSPRAQRACCELLLWMHTHRPTAARTQTARAHSARAASYSCGCYRLTAGSTHRQPARAQRSRAASYSCGCCRQKTNPRQDVLSYFCDSRIPPHGLPARACPPPRGCRLPPPRPARVSARVLSRASSGYRPRRACGACSPASVSGRVQPPSTRSGS